MWGRGWTAWDERGDYAEPDAAREIIHQSDKYNDTRNLCMEKNARLHASLNDVYDVLDWAS